MPSWLQVKAAGAADGAGAAPAVLAPKAVSAAAEVTVAIMALRRLAFPLLWGADPIGPIAPTDADSAGSAVRRW